MRVVVQKSCNGQVVVDGKVVGANSFGLMLLVGFTEGDSEEVMEWRAKKSVNLRIFEDTNDVMNLSLLDVQGDILSISQFTLYANCDKGNRPSYINALAGDKAVVLYKQFNEILRKYNVKVEEGIFGADMGVTFTNQGPTTILLER